MNAQGTVLRYCALSIRHEVQVTCNHSVYYVGSLIVTVTHKIQPYVDCGPIREQSLLQIINLSQATHQRKTVY
jgi:hypothetical protein